MKKQLPVILLSVALVVLLIVAVLLYNKLSATYVPNELLPSDVPMETVAIDDLATDFTFEDTDGNTLSLSSLFGKPIVINFWATWCPPCKAELPAFQSAYEAYGEDVQFIMLNMAEDKSTVLSFAENGGYTFPVYFDTKQYGAIAYGAYSIPMTVFIDKNGQITATQVGMLSETVLTANIDYILGE